MKRIIYLFLLLSTVGRSQSVDKPLAIKIAQNFYDNLLPDTLKQSRLNNVSSLIINGSPMIKVKETFSRNFKNHSSLYIHNMEGGGFVITSANKSTGPVIAYSLNGVININNLPPAFEDLLAERDTIIDFYYNSKETKSSNVDKWNVVESYKPNQLKSLKIDVIHVAPLISTKWDQGAAKNSGGSECGYNYKVPSINTSCVCGKCFVGCVSTAVGQIMNYWGYSTGNDATFKWWDMPLDLDINSPNYITERDAVSHLLERIANKVGMDYCSDGCTSGATMNNPISKYDAKGAFEYYDYDGISTHNYSLNNYNQWVNRLEDELDAGRPILYGVKGHCLVCDGYENEHTFHFNFGWGGSCDDVWYDFEDLGSVPYNSDFGETFYHVCLTGISPNIIDNINFGNESYGDGSDNTYQCKNDIIVAGNNITVVANSGSKLNIVAGNSITLKPGFHAKPGSTFDANIFISNACHNGLKSAVVSTNDSLMTYNQIQKEVSDFNVYPSPFRNSFYIATPNTSNSSITVTIFNMNSVKVYNNCFSYNPLLEISFKDKPAGEYFITIEQNGRISHKKIIKQ
jgi:hypothetical protein